MSEIWLSKSDAADLLSKDGEFVTRQIVPRLATDEKRTLQTRGRPWSLLGSAVVRVYTEWIAEAATGDPDGFSAANSPALERQREARAKLLEWDLAERKKQLMSVDLFRTATLAAFANVRAFAERQIKAHGNGTADDWAETIERFERTLDDALGVTSDDDGATAIPLDGGTAAPAAPVDPGRLVGEAHPTSDGTVCGPAVSSQSPPG